MNRVCPNVRHENITLWSSSCRLKFIHSQFPLPMALNSVFSFIKMSDRDHIISLKICKERSDRIILPKLTNQNNFIIRTLKWIVNKKYFLYSARNGFSTCTHVGFFQSEMIWFINRPILLAPYFLFVQS
jgi:hypothetical protein